jgi:deoxyribodipyrimidine photo-lyase
MTTLPCTLRGGRVCCAFVLDASILQGLLQRGLQASRQVAFMHSCLLALDGELRRLGASLIICKGLPEDEVPALAARLGVEAVYAARDYEPAAIARDLAVMQRLNANGLELHLVKDQVVFDRNDVLTLAGTPFTVFTPYKNAWLKRLAAHGLDDCDTALLAGRLAPMQAAPVPSLDAIGFGAAAQAGAPLAGGTAGGMRLLDDYAGRIAHYQERRDFPATKGPSYLSAHLRFGTVSIRQLVRMAQSDGSMGAQTWLSELIWREFYQMILWHFPHVEKACFKPACDTLAWDDAPGLFAAWCKGQTGYPLVDAAMRQLNSTGYMHNRLRMVAASFLTKDLGVDWRQGAQYFADQLVDHDLAANNGGWQWAASTGCDAQPWFRIFNPVTQSEKFDAAGKFIHRYVAELAGLPAPLVHAPWRMDMASQRLHGVRIGVDYPAPVVDHAVARLRTLDRFGRQRPALSPR